MYLEFGGGFFRNICKKTFQNKQTNDNKDKGVWK